MKWDGETCRCCTREQRLAWSVGDELWERVVIPYFRTKVLCLECFLSMAENAGIIINLKDIDIVAVAIKEG